MKTMKQLMAMLAIFSLVFATSCGDDDGEIAEVNPLIGAYSLNSAVLNEDTDFGGGMEAGTDITEMVELSLYAASPCETGANTLIDLREDFTVFYACKNEDTEPVQFGTWTTSNGGQTLTMSLVVEGNPFPLILDNLEVSEAGVIGDATNYPLVDIGEDGSVSITPANVKINFGRETL